jgi:hypothetical protein
MTKKNTPVEAKPIDLNEIAARNRAVDPHQLAAALEAIRAVNNAGVTMQQFDLVLPFTRLRSAHRRPSAIDR